MCSLKGRSAKIIEELTANVTADTAVPLNLQGPHKPARKKAKANAAVLNYISVPAGI